jgi:hypothetical protein
MSIHGDPMGGGIVRLTIGDKATDYQTKMIPCHSSFGPFAFEYAKQATTEVYHLTCSSPDPTKAQIKCDCAGHTYKGRCKHADALKAILLSLNA